MSEFEEFKKYFEYWRIRLGLADWRVIGFYDRSAEENVAYATVSYECEQHECWVCFYGGLKMGRFNIKEKAFHEVCHLLLADLSELSDSNTDKEEHSVINRLIHAFEDEMRCE